MNARETYNAIQSGSREGMQQAMFDLLFVTQTLSTAVLQLAGSEKRKTGRDPLEMRWRLLLSEFIELPREK
jgi:hypothetical protein